MARANEKQSELHEGRGRGQELQDGVEKRGTLDVLDELLQLVGRVRRLVEEDNVPGRLGRALEAAVRLAVPVERVRVRHGRVDDEARSCRQEAMSQCELRRTRTRTREWGEREREWKGERDSRRLPVRSPSPALAAKKL